MTDPFKHNDRVLTRFGLGTVYCFESIDGEFKVHGEPPVGTPYRVGVTLDPGHTWVGTGLCYFWSHKGELVRTDK